MKLLEAQVAEFGEPQAGRVGEFENRIVAKRFGRSFERRFQQFLDFRGGEIFRKFFPALRQRKIFGDIFGQELFVLAEVVESAKGGNRKIDGTGAEFLFGFGGAGGGGVARGLAGAGGALLLVQQEISEMFQFDCFPILEAFRLRPRDELPEQGGVGALGVRGLATFAAGILQKIVDQVFHLLKLSSDFSRVSEAHARNRRGRPSTQAYSFRPVIFS